MDYIVHWVAKSQRRLSDFHFTKSIACPPPFDRQSAALQTWGVDEERGRRLWRLHAKDFCWPGHISQGLMSCFGNPRLTGTLQSRDRERTRGRCAYHDASSARGVGGWVGWGCWSWTCVCVWPETLWGSSPTGGPIRSPSLEWSSSSRGPWPHFPLALTVLFWRIYF